MVCRMSPDLILIDPTLYTRLPVLDVPGAVSLGISLLTATDATLPEAVKEAAVVVRNDVVELQSQWADQRAAEQKPSADARPADIRVDRGWSAVGRRLEALQPLPIPQAQRATVLYTGLFPTGLVFLTLPFKKEWAESEQRLKQIETQGLTEELNELVGDFVIDEVRAAHKNYGKVLGITDAKEAETVPAKVAEALRMLRNTMAVYCLQLVAAAYAKPNAVELVRKALRPVDDLRAGQQRRSSDARGRDDAASPTEAEVSPTTPVPELG
jgi:hypothetical protein